MGSFALGYLMGMTLSGPNYTPDGYGDNFDEKELKRINDEMYWNAWDSAAKAKVVERLRSGDTNLNLTKFKGIEMYPQFSKSDIADFIENGELKLINFPDGISCFWVDENREEAKNSLYLERYEQDKEDMKRMQFRIIS